MKVEAFDIPLGQKTPDACGQPTISLMAYLLVKNFSQEWIAEQIKVPLGQAVDETFVQGLDVCELYTDGWFQTSLKECKKLLKIKKGVIAVNFMLGNETNPEDNHYAVLSEIKRGAVKLLDTYGRGSVTILRARDFKQIWHYLDPEVEEALLWNWAIVATRTQADLDYYRAIIG